jgi:hypothetical protein
VRLTSWFCHCFSIHHIAVVSVVCSAELFPVQGILFPALRKVKLIPEDAEISSLSYSRCGRTDKGVSALGQVTLRAQLTWQMSITGRKPHKSSACSFHYAFH